MRIVHILLTKHFAGTERHVLQLAEAQSAEHDVHLIMHRKGVRSDARAISPRVPASLTTHVVGSVLRQWTLLQVRRELRRIQPDVIHCHLNGACKSVRGYTSRAPRLATLHIDYDPVQHDHMNGVIAITPYQQQRLPAGLRPRSIQIDNWTQDIEVSIEQARALRAEVGIADNEFVIGTLGRVEPEKNQQLMIESALHAARSSSRPCRVVVVGDGRELEVLRERFPEVIFTGFSAQSSAWFRAFDLFVSAADEEAFGLVFLEALQQRTPVLASATEGAQHLAGRLPIEVVSIGDGSGFVRAIERYLQAGAQRVPASSLTALDDFSVQQKSQQTLAFYEQLATSD